MEITLDEDVMMCHSLKLSAKVILCASRSLPGASRQDLASALGISRQRLHQGLRQAKAAGFETSKSKQEFTKRKQDGTTVMFTQSKQEFTKRKPGGGTSCFTGGKEEFTKRKQEFTPHPVGVVDSSSTGDGPTFAQVCSLATKHKRMDLAQPFFDEYQNRWDEIKNWTGLFGWWVRNKKKVAAPRKPLEELLLEIDDSNNY